MVNAAQKLAYKRQNVWERLTEQEKALTMSFGEEYKKYLNAAKTEREAIGAAVNELRGAGFVPLGEKVQLKAGDKVYAVNRHKSLVAAVIGRQTPEAGFNLLGAHVDSPRLDLKPQPLFEDEGLALFKTHYYGGIKKYQWLSIPLALHGVVIRSDGSTVPVTIGEAPGDPIFTITDLLPHLAKDQMEKKMSEAVPGESLNVLVGGIPLKDSELKDRYKLRVLTFLHENYGFCEEDLISAELELVPAWPARDAGLDRSFIAAYGQDDRVCVFTALRALIDTFSPSRSAVLLLTDKEETGSYGNTGMDSSFFEHTMGEIVARCTNAYSDLLLRRALANSFALSADVNVGLDPNFGDVVEKMNTARLGCGVVLTKYTGSRGKSSTSAAHAEVVAAIRRIFNSNGITWQTGELGKVDQGGGTIAHIMAGHGMDVLDCGVPLLGMHSPLEVASKADIYMAYQGYRAFLTSKDMIKA